MGTLVGLTQGLSGFSMSDSRAVMDFIVTLIPGMRYAFMTSIVGVVGSVAFTLITRAVYGSTEHELRYFYGAMSRYAGVLSVDPMTQVAIYQQEQTALIHQIFKERLRHAGGSQPLPGSDEYVPHQLYSEGRRTGRQRHHLGFPRRRSCAPRAASWRKFTGAVPRPTPMNSSSRWRLRPD